MNPIAVKAVGDSIPSAVKIGFGVLFFVGIGVAWYQIDKHLFKEARQARRGEKKADKYDSLDPNYWTSHQNELDGLTNSQAQKKAKEIYDATFGINDYTKICGVIEECKNKVQLSLIVSEFKSKYGKSMKEYLEDELSNSDYNEVMRSVAKVEKK